MSVVGPGVSEIRIRTEVEHRIFYVAKFEEAVYVLHAFEKKTQKTSKHDIDLARTRLAQVVAKRASAESGRKEKS
jgi:phage-related protein